MAAAFAARYSYGFLADFKRLQPDIQKRILRAIETKLLHDPFLYSKKLVAESGPGQWRFRIGDYRIRFDVEGRVLLFHRVRHRREVYQ